MALLDAGLQKIFGAAFTALYLDAMLAKTTGIDTGTGGFAVSEANYPVKALAAAASDRVRAEHGLPDTAVTISLLRAGLATSVDLDDFIILAGLTYRVIRVESDPAGVAWSVVAVPVPLA